MGIKSVVRSKLHPLVWERLGQAKQEFSWTKQAWQCDEVLVPLFKKYLFKSDGYYIDVGSNDGRASSNTYHLEMSQGWGGILIEPVMHVFFRSRQIRDLTKNKFFNCACVGFNSKVDPVEFLYSGLMSVMKSEHGEHEPESWAELGRPFLSGGEIVQRTWSAARNLESILEESNSPRIIDLLSIDVEGNEFDVLNGINFSNRIFNYILIETQKDSKAYKLLLANKYRHIETIAQNLLFVHTSYVDY